MEGRSMKVIIVGAGRTGRSLIEALAKKNYDITIIDKQKNLVDESRSGYCRCAHSTYSRR